MTTTRNTHSGGRHRGSEAAAPSATRLSGIRSTTRGRRAVTLLSAATLGVGSIVLTGGAAQAAPLPELPNNMVIFPDRDFMTVEGFEGHDGQTARVQVLRAPGETVVGQTDAEVNYPEEGVAFEINHPGGACWGEGAPAGLDVTPDIKGGDVVRLSIDGVTYDTPVADIHVKSESASGSVVTVVSHVPDSVDLARVEARIIEPALGDTLVGRRDARATAVDSGDDGYTSSLVRGPGANEVTATYEFADAETAQIALGGTARIMSWVTAQGEERAGITIAEHEEVGGPGMGGCPPGPGDAAQPAPGAATFVRSADRTSMQVRWTPAEPVAGGAPVTGYQVTVVDSAGNLLGKNVAADVDTATIGGLTAATNYTVQVRAAQGDVLSKAFTAGESTGTPTEGTPGDGTQPVLAEAQFDAETNKLTLSATDPGGGTPQIYYTLDGSPANDADMPALNAELYTGPITLTGTTAVTVNYAAFDAAGNVATGSTTQTPGELAAPEALAAPVVTASSVSGGVKLDWAAIEGATDYQVQVKNANGTDAKPAFNTSGARTTTVTGLTAGTTYSFTVTAVATGRTGTPSAAVTGTPGTFVSKPAIARAQWKSRDFRIEGASDATSGSVQIYRANAQGQLLRANGTVATTQSEALRYGGIVNLTAAVAPEVGTTFSLRLRDGQAPATNPGFVVAIANDGGKSAPTAVANR
jgi:Fibronectin type III domain/Chitobiase/beta-hexosaminidase C-terminal domain